ncbi:hypothetical protein AAF712_016498 [Marasmius tenuissimus]|uniref:Uncharacterized protein n=1 Tax=Marasmius tenuissimus TaxID=585030 RepID=A0ABR2Z7B6_9AGAR
MGKADSGATYGSPPNSAAFDYLPKRPHVAATATSSGYQPPPAPSVHLHLNGIQVPSPAGTSSAPSTSTSLPRPVLGDQMSFTVNHSSRPSYPTVPTSEVIDLTSSDDETPLYPEVLTELHSLLPDHHYLDFKDGLVQRSIRNVNDLIQLAPGFLTDIIGVPQEAAVLIVNHAQTLLHRAKKGKGKAPAIHVKQETEDRLCTLVRHTFLIFLGIF